MTHLLTSIFQTSFLTRDDCQQILFTLFDTEECLHSGGSPGWLESKVPAPVVDPDTEINTPSWSMSELEFQCDYKVYRIRLMSPCSPV